MHVVAKKAWQKTLQEYLGNASVASQIASRFEDFPIHDGFNHNMVSPHLPGFEFRFSSSTWFQIIDQEKDNVVGYFQGAARVAPEYQGRGLTPELYVLIDEVGAEDRTNWLLTPSSFGARKAAHRRHVERALSAGLDVPDVVLAQYERGETGRLQLREDYTPAQCNLDYQMRRYLEKSDEFLAVAGGYSRYTFDIDNPIAVNQALENDPASQEWGVEFILELHARIGGELLCTRAMREDDRCKEMAVQILKDGMVIDAIGIRSFQTSTADLRYRNEQIFMDGGFFFETTEIPPAVTIASPDEVRSYIDGMDDYFRLNGPTPEALQLMAAAREKILAIYEPAELTI